MKKKILYIGILGVMAFSSCKKELVQTPSNGISSDIVFNNPGDFDLATKGMYAGLRGQASYLGGESVLFGDILSDNMIINSTGRRSYQEFNRWIYSSNSTSGLFGNAYSVIRRANAILLNIDKLPAGASKNNITAEALAVRAMAHFDVLRLYAKRYTAATENTDLGIPFVTSIDVSLLPSRNTMKESYDKIIADFVQAEGLANVSNGVGRLNKAAIIGLLSKVYLNKSDWANAAAAADRALAVAPGTSDNPGSAADVPNIFIDATEKGVMFKIKMLDEDNVKIGTYYSQTIGSDGTKSEYVPTFDFYSLYTATDVRKAAYIKTGLYVPASTTYNHVAKWLSRPGSTANILDYKVLRVAEVLLNKAEAYAQNSSVKDEAKALATLNILRAQRYVPYVAGTETGAALLAAIDKERRLELAFEGHRFYDLKRQNVAIVRDAVHGDNSNGNGAPIPAAYVTLPANSKNWAMPFPQSEININKNLVQDPEWK
ncbi:RagB/SusD family nutrient uptake outer membrane protein [Pedobacter gandavensis]|uniref:RagB/SusD family nutrient uptake outer membrane protein n=1 Tax=Pedobacter gandavensis TaxID=2679963 RepID=UPI00292ED6CD|nr:RagB/SusD family nutrient uptake outer membrane protein [Pedobacter gandavensis]